jgi:hypothetical protein
VAVVEVGEKPGWAGSQSRRYLVAALGIVMSSDMNGKALKWFAASPAGMLLAGAIAAAPGPATPVQAVAAALGALAATFTDDRREFAVRLLAVIAANSELRERAAFKHIGLTEAMAEALEKRGVPDLTASLAAELGIRAFERSASREHSRSSPGGASSVGAWRRRRRGMTSSPTGTSSGSATRRH